ncbi:MAG: HDOD domain-containing protein [Candidatus Competibacteraceae bacterium]|nr:HDOD domain-containing protein [Candidatus Competibacteraceae bacterium]
MNLPDPVQTFLDRQQLSYRLISCLPNETLSQTRARLDIPAHRMIRTVLLKDASGLLMAILPYNYILDFSILCQLRASELEPLHGSEVISFFQTHGCQGNSRPPLPAVFNLPAVVDTSLANSGEIYFESGSGDSLLNMRNNDFSQLLAQVRWGQFAIPIENLDFPTSQQLVPKNLVSLTNRYTPTQSRASLESITELPAISPVVQRILELRANPQPPLPDILQIVEQDSGHAARIMYWARTPLHDFHSPVDSLKTAISQTIGPENTLNLLLGSSMAEIFHISAEGSVGLKAIWRHSIYCAALVGELVKALPEPPCVNPSMAYLCGLLHDFGYLVLGHALPAQFFLLNRFLAVNRHVPISEVERYVMGAEHWQIGAWLMQSWNLPEEVIATTRWHHSEDSTHPYAEYSNLVLIANRLLHYFGLGEEHNNRLPALAMFMLGLTRDQAMAAVNQIHACTAELDSLSAMLPLPQEKP